MITNGEFHTLPDYPFNQSNRIPIFCLTLSSDSTKYIALNSSALTINQPQTTPNVALVYDSQQNVLFFKQYVSNNRVTRHIYLASPASDGSLQSTTTIGQAAKISIKNKISSLDIRSTLNWTDRYLNVDPMDDVIIMIQSNSSANPYQLLSFDSTSGTFKWISYTYKSVGDLSRVMQTTDWDTYMKTFNNFSICVFRLLSLTQTYPVLDTGVYRINTSDNNRTFLSNDPTQPQPASSVLLSGTNVTSGTGMDNRAYWLFQSVFGALTGYKYQRFNATRVMLCNKTPPSSGLQLNQITPESLNIQSSFQMTVPLGAVDAVFSQLEISSPPTLPFSTGSKRFLLTSRFLLDYQVMLPINLLTLQYSWFDDPDVNIQVTKITGPGVSVNPYTYCQGFVCNEQKKYTGTFQDKCEWNDSLTPIPTSTDTIRACCQADPSVLTAIVGTYLKADTSDAYDLVHDQTAAIDQDMPSSPIFDANGQATTFVRFAKSSSFNSWVPDGVYESTKEVQAKVASSTLWWSDNDKTFAFLNRQCPNIRSCTGQGPISIVSFIPNELVKGQWILTYKLNRQQDTAHPGTSGTKVYYRPTTTRPAIDQKKCGNTLCPWSSSCIQNDSNYLSTYCSSLDEYGMPRVHSDKNCFAMCSTNDNRSICATISTTFCNAFPAHPACACINFQQSEDYAKVLQAAQQHSDQIPDPACWAYPCTVNQRLTGFRFIEDPNIATNSDLNQALYNQNGLIARDGNCKANFMNCSQTIQVGSASGGVDIKDNVMKQICQIITNPPPPPPPAPVDPVNPTDPTTPTNPNNPSGSGTTNTTTTTNQTSTTTTTTINYTGLIVGIVLLVVAIIIAIALFYYNRKKNQA